MGKRTKSAGDQIFFFHTVYYIYYFMLFGPALTQSTHVNQRVCFRFSLHRDITSRAKAVTHAGRRCQWRTLWICRIPLCCCRCCCSHRMETHWSWVSADNLRSSPCLKNKRTFSILRIKVSISYLIGIWLNMCVFKSLIVYTSKTSIPKPLSSSD